MRRGADGGEASHAPYRLADFTGRSRELAAIHRLLADIESSKSPVVSPIVVSGPAGIGKSSTAIEALHSPDLAFATRLFVDLRGFADKPLSPFETTRLLLKKLMPADDEPSTLDSALTAWKAATEGRNDVVVLLDNTFDEDQVRPIITASPHTPMIVTSRRPLIGLDGVRVVVLSHLDREQSLLLLDQILTGRDVTVAQLDRLAAMCDDLPLAIRVAGSRLASRPAWTAAEFIDRLSQEDARLQVLTSGDRGVASAFGLSYRVLNDTDRALFRSLSLLSGPSFSAELVAAISGQEADASEVALENLSDLGLVEPLSGGRYRLHDLVRLYARDRYRAEVDSQAALVQRKRFETWTIRRTNQLASLFISATWAGASTYDDVIRHAARWLTAEADYCLSAVRAALEDGDYVAVLETARCLVPYVIRRQGKAHNWRELYEMAVFAAETSDNDHALAEQLIVLCGLQELEGDLELAVDTAKRGVEMGLASLNLVAVAEGLVSLAQLSWQLGDKPAAVTFSERGAHLFRAMGMRFEELNPLTWLSRSLEDPERILQVVGRIQDLLETSSGTYDLSANDRWDVNTGLVRILVSLGRYDEAEPVAQALVDEAHRIDHDEYRARALRHLGFVQIGRGRFADARVSLVRAVELAGPNRPDWWAEEVQEAIRSTEAASNEAHSPEA